MEGYSILRTRVQRFLNDNPDVQMVTLKRPMPEKRRVYANSDAECFGRMPESCPILQAILIKHLPDSGTIKLTEIVDGEERGPIDIDALRDAIFSDVHAQITSKFRREFEAVCAQKHSLLANLRNYQRQLQDWIERAETELPPEDSGSPRLRSRREGNGVVEVEIEDDDL